MHRALLQELCLLAAGLLLLGAIILHYFDPGLNPFGLGSDTHEFWHLSTTLLRQHQFAYTDLRHYPLVDLSAVPVQMMPATVPCTVRVPGYPFLLAVVRAVWDSPWSALMLNVGCYVGLCCYSYGLGRLIIKEDGWRRVFNILVTCSPVYLTRWGVGADLAAGFLITGFLFHVAKTFLTPGFRPFDPYVAAIYGSLAVLTRANLLVWIITLLSLLILMGRKSPAKSARPALALILVTIGLTVAGWMLRNAHFTGRPVISTQSGPVCFTVHLAYDLKPTDSLYPWIHTKKQEFLLESLRQGLTFNQAEERLDQKLQSLVQEHYQRHPLRFLTKGAETIRTLFLFSYYDVSDVLVYMMRPWHERLAFVNGSSSQRPTLETNARVIRDTLFQVSRFYKMSLALTFFAYLFIVISQKKVDEISTLKFALYFATLAGVLSTSLLTGAAGDRLRLPFNAAILLFSVLFCKTFSTVLCRQPKQETAR